MKHIINTLTIALTAAAALAGCALEEEPGELDTFAPGVPSEIVGLPASFDANMSVAFTLPGDLSCGDVVDSGVDIDPQMDGVQIAVQAQGDYDLLWIRLVAQDRDTWYNTVNGATTITLSPGANQLTAVGSSADSAGQSNYCFITM